MIKKNKGTALTTALFASGKGLYVLSLFVVSDFLHNSWSASTLLLSVLLLFCAAIVFLTLQHSWPLLWSTLRVRDDGSLGKKESSMLSDRSPGSSGMRPLLLSAFNGLSILAAFYLFNVGLERCGPIRALLMEFCDSSILAIPAMLLGVAAVHPGRRRGLLLVGGAVLILLFTQETSLHDQEAKEAIAVANLAKVQQGEEAEGVDRLTASISAPLGSTGPHSVSVLFLNLSEGLVGMLALLLSATISSLQKVYENKQAKDYGGRKKFHAVSMCVGCVAALPILLLEYAISSDTHTLDTSADSVGSAALLSTGTQSPLGWFGSTATFVFLVAFYVVMPFFVEALAARATADQTHLLVKVNLAVSVGCAAVLDVWRGEGRLTLATAAAAGFLFAGVHYLSQAAGKGRDGGLLSSPSTGGSSAPHYSPLGGSSKGSSGTSHGLIGFSMRELKVMLRHFLSDKTSSRIFFFFIINFLFMFVELIYGFYSNSLGLISDAGHMAFDCTALAIGLYASYVSKLKPNSLYTYGYTRYEILSGYVNAVFLLFIGYFIFVESVERLFRPPEITSDSLVLVSVLGLMVNMVGLFFFHDHSGHGHSHGGGGHGHSHGGGGDSHGHSHGGKEEGDHGHSHGGGMSAEEEAHRNSNMFAIYLHVLADALGSVGVIISSLLVKYKGWMWADAVCSIIISVLIVASVLPLIQSTLQVLNQRTPAYKENGLRNTLRRLTSEIDGVLGYREPHFWAFSDTETIGTLHVVVREDVEEQKVLAQILDLFKESGAGVANLTVQMEKQRFLNTKQAEMQERPLLTGGQL